MRDENVPIRRFGIDTLWGAVKGHSGLLTYVDGVVTRVVYDGAQIVLALDGSSQVTDRSLWGPAIDMLLADQEVTISSATTLWAIGDHQKFRCK